LQVICASTYHLVTPALAAGALRAAIYKGEKFSDHAPVQLEQRFWRHPWLMGAANF
jgi:hypothetical protein